MALDYSEPVRPEPPKRPEMPRVRPARVREREVDISKFDNPGVREVFADEIRSVERQKAEERRDIAREERERRARNAAEERFNERLRSYRQDVRNAEFEEKARRDGMKFYKDEFGNFRSELDPLTNKPVFDEGFLGETEKDGERWQVYQSRDGARSLRKPEMIEPDDPEDPFFYYEWGDGTRERAAHVDDVLQMEGVDDDTRFKAQKRSEKLRNNLSASVGDVIEDRIAKVEIAEAEAKQKMAELDRQWKEAQRKRDLLAEKVKSEDSESMWRDASPATQQAFEDADARVAEILAERNEVAFSLEEGGTIYSQKEIAENDKQIFDAVKELGGIEEVEERIRSGKFAGSEEAAREMLATLEQRREELGLGLSQVAAHRRQVEERRRAEEERFKAEAGETYDRFMAEKAPEEWEPTDKKLVELRAVLEDKAKVIGEAQEQIVESYDNIVANDYESREEFDAAMADLNALRERTLSEMAQYEGSKDYFEEIREGFEAQAQAQTDEFAQTLIEQRNSDKTLIKAPSLFGFGKERIEAAVDYGGRRVEDAKEVYKIASGNNPGDSYIEEAVKVFDATQSVVFDWLNVARGMTQEDLDRNQRITDARRILLDVPDKKVPEMLRMSGEFQNRLSNEELPPEARRIVPESKRKGGLKRLEDALIILEKGERNAVQQGLISGIGTLSDLPAVIADKLSFGLADFTELQGVDTKNPEDVALYNALKARYMEVLVEKYPNSSLTGQVFGSVGQFMITRKIGKLGGKAVQRAPVIGRRMKTVLSKGNRAERFGDTVGYATFGAVQSFGQNPAGVGWVDRLIDIGVETGSIMIAEKTGQRLEQGIAGMVRRKATAGNVALHSGAELVGSALGEAVSELTESVVRGEDAVENAREILQGTLTVSLAFGLGGATRNLRGAQRFRAISESYGQLLSETLNRSRDVFAAPNTLVTKDQRNELLDLVGRESYEAVKELFNTVTAEGMVDLDADIGTQAEQMVRSMDYLAVLNDTARAVQNRMGASIDAAQEIDRAPDFVEKNDRGYLVGPPDTGRKAAIGLLKFANGETTLTASETRAIKTLEKFQEEEFLAEVDGQTILTDAGQQFLGGIAPSSAALVKGREVDRRRKAKEFARLMQEREQAENREVQPFAFTAKEKAELQEAVIELPGSESTEESAAEAEKIVPVRSAEETAEDPEVTPAMLLRSAKKVLGADSVKGKKSAEGARAAAAQINGAIQVFGRYFDGVKINDRGGDVGGMAVIEDGGKRVLEINPSGLAKEGDVLAAKTGRAGILAQEEMGHRILLQMVPGEEVSAIWEALPEGLKETVRQGYSGTLSKENEGFAGGHEFLRMLLQGRLNLEGKEGSAILSEETGRKGWVARARKVLDRIIKIAKDIRGNLEAEGVEAEMAERIDDYISQAESLYKTLAPPKPAKRKTEAKAEPETEGEESTQAEKKPAARQKTTETEETSDDEGQKPVQEGGGQGQREERAEQKPRKRKEPKVLGAEDAKRVAGALGQKPEDLGNPDQVSHREDTYRTVYAVVEASDLRPSHDDSGRLLDDYPEDDLQPRAREGEKYINQVRTMSANFKQGEEGKTGGADSGTPIMAIINGQAYTLIGNGRAAARQRMWDQHKNVAAGTREWLLDNAGDYGISTGHVEGMKEPVLVRVLTKQHSNEYLRHISEESNKPNTMEASEFENAKMYARRLSRRALGLLNPDYDLDADANSEFMDLYLANTGQSKDANKTSREYANQAKLVLFIKAYGADETSFASLERLTGNSDDSSKRITSALARQAATFADLRFQQGRGELYPVSVSAELMRGAQEIEVALRNKRYNQTVSDVLDGLLDQEMLGTDEKISRSPLEKDVLWFLVNYRNNQGVLEDVFSSFADAVYGAGSPLQVSLFGASAGMGPRTMWDNAVRMVINRENTQRAEKNEKLLPMPRAIPQEEINADEVAFSDDLEKATAEARRQLAEEDKAFEEDKEPEKTEGKKPEAPKMNPPEDVDPAERILPGVPNTEIARTLRSRMVAPINGTKPDMLQGSEGGPIYANALLKMQEVSSRVADMFFGGGVVTDFLHLSGQRKPGQIATEYESSRYVLASQLAQGNAERIGERVGELHQKATDLVDKVTAIQAETVDEAIAQYEKAVRGAGLAHSEWLDRLIEVNVSGLRDSWEREFDRDSIEIFGRLRALQVFISAEQHSLLESGQYLEKSAADARNYTQFLADLKAGQDTMFKVDPAQPLRLENKPETAALTVFAQNVIGSQGNLITDGRADGRLQWPFTKISGSKDSARILNAQKMLTDYREALEGVDVRQGDSWAMLDGLADEFEGIGFIVDPSYFAESEEKGTSNYNYATEIQTPEDLEFLVEQYLLPLSEKGARFVLSNSWNEGLAQRLAEKGLFVQRSARGSAQEIVATNFDPSSGEIKRNIGDVGTGSADQQRETLRSGLAGGAGAGGIPDGESLGRLAFRGEAFSRRVRRGRNVRLGKSQERLVVRYRDLRGKENRTVAEEREMAAVEKLLGQQFFGFFGNVEGFAGEPEFELQGEDLRVAGESDAERSVRQAQNGQIRLFAGGAGSAREKGFASSPAMVFIGRDGKPTQERNRSPEENASRALAFFEGVQAGGGSEASTTDTRQRDWRKLYRWASLQGLRIRAEDFRSKFLTEERELTPGAEHSVYEDPETGRVIKVTHEDAADRGMEPVDYLRNHLNANALFADQIRFEGMVDLGNGPQAVISQPFVAGRKPTYEEIESFMKERMGFRKTKRGTFRSQDGIEVDDLNPLNAFVVESKNTFDLVPIDVHVTVPEGVELRAGGAGESRGIRLDDGNLLKTPSEFVYTESKTTDERIKEIAGQRGIRLVDPSDPRPEIDRAADAAGVTVQFYEGEVERGEQGFVAEGRPDVIFVRADSDRAPVAWTLAHELIHVAQKDISSGYAELEKRVFQILKRSQLLKMAGVLRPFYGENFRSEIISYLAGDAISGVEIFGISDFWGGKEVVAEIQSFFKKATGFDVSGLPDGGSDAELATDLSTPWDDWGTVQSRPGVVVGYRGDDGTNKGDAFGTEGVGLYVARSPETAEFFGDVRRVKFDRPANPLLVDEEILPILNEFQDAEFNDIPLEITPEDSTWMRLNKQALANLGGEANWARVSDGALQRELTRLIRAEGYDAVYVRSGGEEWAVLFPPAPGQMFMELRAGGAGNEGRRFVRREPPVTDPLGFYSRLREAVANADMGASKPKSAMQWAGVIRKWAKGWTSAGGALWRDGIAEEEIKWSGVIPWLKEKKQATRAEVLEYLEGDGAVQFQEVVLGEAKFDTPHLTTPGGKNYREVVLTIPERRGRTPLEIARKLYGDQVGSIYDLEPEQMEEVESIYQQDVGEVMHREYKSSHFDGIPNYVAHMRLNERTDGEGNDGLFIEEIQSDRHQQGRNKGYRSKDGWLHSDGTWFADEGEASEYARVNGGSYSPAKNSGIPDAPYRKDWGLAMFKRALRDAVASGKDWIGWTTGNAQADRYDLRMRLKKVHVSHSLREGQYRVEAYGKDDVLSVPAIDQTVPREELPEVIGKELADRALKMLDEPVTDDDLFKATGSRINGREVIYKDGSTLTYKSEENARAAVMRDFNLDRYGAESFTQLAELKGDNLEIGGDGMRGFYDKMLPAAVGRYVAQWGGKVEDGRIGIPYFDLTDPASGVDIAERNIEEATTFHKVAITDAMRDGLVDGQALFAGGAGRPTQTFLPFVEAGRPPREPRSPKLDAIETEGDRREAMRKYMDQLGKHSRKFAEWVEKLPDVVPFVSPNSGVITLVSPDINQETPWRTTRFNDRDGEKIPLGHSLYHSKVQAVEEASRYGGVYTPEVLFAGGAGGEQQSFLEQLMSGPKVGKPAGGKSKMHILRDELPYLAALARKEARWRPELAEDYASMGKQGMMEVLRNYEDSDINDKGFRQLLRTAAWRRITNAWRNQQTLEDNTPPTESLQESVGEEGETRTREEVVADDFAEDARQNAERGERIESVKRAMRMLSDEHRAVMDALSFGQSIPEIAKTTGYSVKKVRRLREQGLSAIRGVLKVYEGENVRLSAGGAGNENDSETTGPTGRPIWYDAAMAELYAGIPSKEDLKELYEIVGLEPPEQKASGRPDLANLSSDEDARRLVDTVDEWRKKQYSAESQNQWNEEAEKLVANDPEGVTRDLLARVEDGRGIDDPILVKAAQKLVGRMTAEAVASRDTAKIHEAAALVWGYRESRAATAKALAAGKDPFKTPEERHREFLSSMIFRPDRGEAKRIREAPTAAFKERTIADLKEKIREARDRIRILEADRKSGNVTAADGAEMSQQIAAMRQDVQNMRLELGRVTREKSQAELRNEVIDSQLSTINKALAGMGVTVDDILNGDTYVGLVGNRIAQRLAEHLKLSDVEARAAEMVGRVFDYSQIQAATGLNREQVDKLKDRLKEALKEQYREKVAKGKMRASDIVRSKDELRAGEADFDVEAELEKIATVLGFQSGTGPENITIKAGKRRKKLKRSARRASKQRLDEAPDRPSLWWPEAEDRHHPRGAQRKLTDPGEPPVLDISDPVHVAQVARTIQASHSSGFDMAYEFWINGILSGPLTHGANIMGNAINATWDMTFKRFLEASINSVVGKKDGVQWGEFPRMIRAIGPALHSSWLTALDVWRTETPMFTNEMLNQQMEMDIDIDKVGGAWRRSIPDKAGGRIVRIPGRLLMATDEWFKGMIGHMQTAAVAYRIAKAQGLTGEALEAKIRDEMESPKSMARIAAVDKALELTFQEKDEEKVSGKISTAASDLRRRFPVAGFVVPFVVTPVNIFAQGIRQSPLGILNLAWRGIQSGGTWKISDRLEFKQKDYPAALAMKHLAEQMVAWTASAVLYGAAEGDDDDEDKFFLITGSKPYQGAASRAAQYRTGLAPYTVRIGNFSFRYGRIEPVATVLGTTVDMIKGVKSSKKTGDWTPYSDFLNSIMLQTTEKTFMRGIGDYLEAFLDTSNADEGMLGGYRRESLAATFISSWVPNILKQPAREFDSKFRDRGSGLMERVLRQVAPWSGLPSYDIYGNTEEKQGVALTRMLIPVKGGDAPEINRIDRALLNFNQQNPDESWWPAPVRRTVRLGDEHIELTAEQFNRYEKLAGEIAWSMVQVIPIDTRNPTLRQVERIKRAFSKARRRAKEQILAGS